MRSPLPGDQARVSVTVAVTPAVAFRLFTEEIDLWWRRSPAYRRSGAKGGVIRIDAGIGGRITESYETPDGPRVEEAGCVTAWDPPSRLVFDWKGANFAPGEVTEVEFSFEPTAGGTMVTVTHRGWSRLRPDHPVRHGLETVAFIRMVGLWWGDLMTSLREHATR